MAGRRYATTQDARAVGDMLPPLAWLVTVDGRSGIETRTPVQTRRALVTLRRMVGADRIRRPWLAHRFEYRLRKGRDLQAETDETVAR